MIDLGFGGFRFDPRALPPDERTERQNKRDGTLVLDQGVVAVQAPDGFQFSEDVAANIQANLAELYKRTVTATDGTVYRGVRALMGTKAAPGPTPQQAEFMDAQYRWEYVLFGGSAGPGKSYALRWAAVEFLIECARRGIYGVRVGLFSEDYPTLRDRQISKIKREFPSWLGVTKETKDEGLAFHISQGYGGGVIVLRNLKDASSYFSTEFAAEYVDELTRDPPQVFHDLRSRKRWPGVDHNPFMAATNPGGIGHAEVKKLWVDGDFSGEDDGELDPTTFKFIRALPTTNPHLSKSYWNTLNTLPPDMRRALRDGDWDLWGDGQVFSTFRREIHVCKPFALDPSWPRWIAVDWGWDSPFCCLWFTRIPKGASIPDADGTMHELRSPRTVVYREVYRRRLLAQDQAALILKVSNDHGEFIQTAVGDSRSMWQRGRNPITGERAIAIADEYAAAGLPILPAANNRYEGVQRIHRALDHQHELFEPELLIFEEVTQDPDWEGYGCPNLIRELPSLPKSETNPELWDDDASDHAVDSLAYGLQAGEGIFASWLNRPTTKLQLGSGHRSSGRPSGLERRRLGAGRR